MGRMRFGRVAFTCAVALASLVAASVAVAQVSFVPDYHGKWVVNTGSTGDNSELVEWIPIARGRKPRTVMSLPLSGRFGSGDLLETRAEVEVSTTCLTRSRRCVGKRYGYSPRVRAQLVLGLGLKKRGIKLSKTKRIRCSQERPNRNHHCVIAIAGRTLRVSDPAQLRCQQSELNPDCRVNLVLKARHPRARKGHRLVIGADAPRGVQGDRGRIYGAVHSASRRGLPKRKPDRRKTDDVRRKRLPVAPRGKSGRARVVASIPLRDARINDQYIVDAKMRVGLAGLPYNALVRSELILATRPDATRSRGAMKNFASQSGSQINEANGFNCTRGRSAHRSPCKVEKHAMFRLTGHPPRTNEQLFVNLVARSGAALGGRHRRSDRARVKRASISYRRYRGPYCRVDEPEPGCPAQPSG